MAGDAVAKKERRARLFLRAAEQVQRPSSQGTPTGMMLRQGENFYRCAVSEPGIPSLPLPSPRFRKLMDPLPGKPISSVPKFANWTPLAFVIDAFLVRTPDYAIGHGDRSHLMLFDKFKYLTGNGGIGADVATLHLPVA